MQSPGAGRTWDSGAESEPERLAVGRRAVAGGGPWQGPVVWAWPVAVRVWVFMPSARGSHGGFEREEWCGPVHLTT